MTGDNLILLIMGGAGALAAIRDRSQPKPPPPPGTLPAGVAEFGWRAPITESRIAVAGGSNQPKGHEAPIPVDPIYAWSNRIAEGANPLSIHKNRKR